eukprot:TRINITY_DN491_c0_g1_i6.p1 TRINITY_DN491_c0_g1~~TRINITY_DN491_c0_g1_i6.p1  ORF type:complete len:1622 (+),score=360.31 TRINITY_DN491_c0_g1_i6:67-4932(+)
MSGGWRDPFQEKKEPYKPNPKTLDGVPDLCMLTYLAEENVLHNLSYRYKEGKVYTSTTSKVLVAVNPYERMDSIYTKEMMAKYQSAEINLEGLQSDKDLPPHVFTVANSAYQNLLVRKQNQSIIVCGESGSGKTESAKYQMRFLAFTTTSSSKDKSEFEAADKVGQQVLDANPILESFGNAKTLLNNNSSRFGKFTKMMFDEVKVGAGEKQRKKLVGAIIETYLLEKSRVVKQDKGERTFHVFYQLTFNHKGHADLPDLKLGPVEQFHYTNQSGVHTLDDLRFPGKSADGEWFKELMEAFKTLAIPRTETDDVFKIVSGVLHTGNINFEQLKGEGSEIKNKDELAVAAEMFQVKVEGLEKRLKTRSILLPGDKLIIKPLNEPDAVFNRDSLSRNLYNGLFRWVVARVNKVSGVVESSSTSWIGILDVFGFEIFEHNSFEQFCINFCNERLQQYFNEHVLKAEQDLYKKEALLWDPIDLPDNQDCIDLVTNKPYGILPILDSTCVQPQGTHEVFTANLFKAHKYHPRLREMKQQKAKESDKQFTAMNGFVIRHYAGAVVYDCAEFLVKNADASEFDSIELFVDSKSPIAAEILRIRADGKLEDAKRSSKRAFLSTGTVFAEQLDSLMKTLKQTAPYFVRCVKPNPKKAPKDFEGEYVRPQLRCGGLIEALRIIKLGFPTRCAYKRVHELFGVILKDQKPMPNLNIRDFSQAVMEICGEKGKIRNTDMQLGLSMVFFRPGCQTYLTDILEKKPEVVTPQQRILIRKFMIKKRWIRARGTVRALNKTGKMLNEMRFKKAAVAMILIYRTVGRALRDARNILGGKKDEADRERKSRDEAFMTAMRAAEELKKATAMKAEMEATIRKQAEDNQRALVEKDAQMERQEGRIREFLEKLRASEDRAAEMQRKSGKMHEDVKTKAGEIQSQLITVGAEKDRATTQARSLEGQISSKTEELAGKDKQIADRQATIDGLKKDIEALKEEMSKSSEAGQSSMGAKIKEMNEQKEAFGAEKDRLEGEIKDREAEIQKLHGDVTDGERKIAGLKDNNENKDRINDEKSADYERQLADAKRQIEELRAEIENLRKRLDETKIQSESAARAAQEALNVARQEARDEKAKLERSVSDKESEIAKLESDLVSLRQHAEAASKSASENLHAEREESRERAERLEKVTAEKDTALNAAKRDLALATGKLEAASAAQASLTARSSAQFQEHTEKMQELGEKNERSIRKLDTKITEAQSELVLFKDRLENVNRELKLATQVNEDNKQNFDRQVKERDHVLAETKAELRKAQAKYDQVVQSATEKLALLQEQLNTRRTQEKENQTSFDKQLWEKNRELMEVKSQLEALKSRLTGDKDRSEIEKKQLEDSLSTQKAEAAARLEKYEEELRASSDDLAELKADFRTDRKDWKEKQDKYERQLIQLQREVDSRQDQITAQTAKLASIEKQAKEKLEAFTSNTTRREASCAQQLEELKAAEKDLEAQVASIRAEKQKALQDLESEKQGSRERDRKRKEEVDKLKAENSAKEKEFISYRGDVGATGASKMEALTGSIQTLKTTLEAEKHDKEEAKKREAEYRVRLKETSSQLGESLGELKHIQTTHDAEIGRAVQQECRDRSRMPSSA